MLPACTYALTPQLVGQFGTNVGKRVDTNAAALHHRTTVARDRRS